MREGRPRPPLSRAGWYLPVLAVSVLLVMSCADDDDASTSTTLAATTPSSTSNSTSTSISTSTSTSISTSSTLPKNSTTSVSPASCVEVLEHDCEGEAVERLQRLLRTRIDGRIAIDGSFGDQTEGALREFEQFDCPVTTCIVDGRILVDGPEWDVLTDLPELTTPTFELSP